jgi:hypothetical protein
LYNKENQKLKQGALFLWFLKNFSQRFNEASLNLRYNRDKGQNQKVITKLSKVKALEAKKQNEKNCIISKEIIKMYKGL